MAERNALFGPSTLSGPRKSTKPTWPLLSHYHPPLLRLLLLSPSPSPWSSLLPLISVVVVLIRYMLEYRWCATTTNMTPPPPPPLPPPADHPALPLFAYLGQRKREREREGEWERESKREKERGREWERVPALRKSYDGTKSSETHRGDRKRTLSPSRSPP